ncbi:hypothetical protein V5N11_005725 [Cardamine amara subsp. amara]|uniref:Uncharacterized protein n=1 Tax=Cardamine amara subsp. amara TaxID=228776 RepID=A0ABD1B5D0_CARAN
MALQAWTEAKLRLPRAGFSQSLAFVNIHLMLACIDKQSIDPLTRRTFPWVLWNIWKAHNSFFFEQVCISAESLVKKAHDEADEWFIANTEPERPLVDRKSFVTRIWRPPLYYQSSPNAMWEAHGGVDNITVERHGC